MQIYLLFVFSIIGAFYRRFLGQTYKHFGRAVKIVILALLSILMIHLTQNISIVLKSGLKCVLQYVLAITFFIITIIRSHGDYFFMFDKNVDEGRNKIVDWLLQKIFGKDNYYNFFGNFVGLFLTRVLWCFLCSLCMPKPYFIFFAIAYPLSYAIAQGITKPNGEEHYISASEYTVGFCYFGLFYLSLI